MCAPISFVTNGRGKVFYFDVDQRKKLLEEGTDPVDFDSHSFIVQYYREKSLLADKNTVEDQLNKYEYTLGEDGFRLVLDRLNTRDDSEQAKKWAERLDIESLFVYVGDKYKYLYCNDVKDRKELWSTITDDHYKYLYCRDVKDRKELWSTIMDDYCKYCYCRDVKDRKELWSTITNDYYKYCYCRDIKDRKEFWSTITDDHYKYLYCRDVKDRKELWSNN